MIWTCDRTLLSMKLFLKHCTKSIMQTLWYKLCFKLSAVECH